MTLRADRGVDAFRERQAGTLAEKFGAEATVVADNRVELQLKLQHWMLAPNGFLHAASVVLLVDTCAGYACFSHLPVDAKGFTTLEMKVNFLGSTGGGTLRAKGVAEHLGRSTQVWSVTAFDDRDRAIALFRCTQMILW